MIDLHSHILPGMDDGPKSTDKALDMCDMAIEDGIKTIVATPHHLNGVYKNERLKILDNIKSFRKIIHERGRDIEILPGSDVHMDADLLGGIKKNEIMTVNNNGRFLLLELPHFFLVEQIKQMIFAIKLKGITLIVSHPERNNTLMEDMNILYDLIEMGTLVQITVGSITGDFGRAVKRNAFALLRLNMVHILATDAHNTSTRPPLLSKALGMISKVTSAEDARKMVSETPAAVIKGVMPSIKEPLRKKKSYFMSFFGINK